MSTIPEISISDLPPLFERLGSVQAKRRMQIQVEHSATLFGAGLGRLHFENIRSVRIILEAFLRISGLKTRAAENCKAYIVEAVETELQSLPHSFDSYRILHLSDLHADELVDKGEGIVSLIDELKFDLAVVTGDYRFETNGDYSRSLSAMRPIISALSAAEDGCFGILGNHDFLEMVPALERMGLRMLLNERVSIRRGVDELVLAGVDDPHFYGTHDPVRAIGSGASGNFTVLLSHTPEIIKEAESIGTDLYLCGHSHGGQICLPGGVPIIANTNSGYRYLSGSWEYRGMKGYTSRGAGFSTAAARFFCPPEIALHTLKRKTVF